MPRNEILKKVLVIGSGPIVIGQAAEFDYAGTQACKSLREEGVEVVLVNSNPATIMTDEDIADRVYIEPLTVPIIQRIIEREKPDGILGTLGGQTGLNLTVELEEAGALKDVVVMGTKTQSIRKAEDRELFASFMEEIGEPISYGIAVTTIEDAEAAAEEIGVPRRRPTCVHVGRELAAVSRMTSMNFARSSNPASRLRWSDKCS